MNNLHLSDGHPDAHGMFYMATAPQEIVGGFDESGNFLTSAISRATAPIRAGLSVAHQAAMAPFNVARRLLPSAPGGGAPGAPAAPPPDPTQDAPSPDDGQGDPSMYADTSGRGLRHPGFGHHRHRAHTAGWGMPDFMSHLFNKPAGKLLISAVPGGATAMQARDIANKALADGSLDPSHLKAAGAITKLARQGHKASIAKIAKLKRAAGGGDPHAEVAMDRLKLADSIQHGKHSGQTTSTLRNLRNLGLASMPKWARL